MLFELACDAGVEGEVAGVVNAWCDLVDDQVFVTVQEVFNAGDSYDVQGFEHFPREVNGGDVDRTGYISRGGRDVQYVVAVLVFDGTVMGVCAIQSPRGHNRKFEVEIYERFEDGILPLH